MLRNWIIKAVTTAASSNNSKMAFPMATTQPFRQMNSYIVIEQIPYQNTTKFIYCFITVS